MNSEIVGNSYRYIIDTAYGINKDGFIAIGSESIVYKGLKTKKEGGLQFSCVLKFKPKYISFNGETVDRLELFKTVEWKIFEELRECRSIVRIDDVIDDIGDFRLPCNRIDNGVIDNVNYFCVVEEFIDGWSLEEYCREEHWKLRQKVSVGNSGSGLQEIKEYDRYSDKEKERAKNSYNYENIVKYQNQILLFMINLCEIMEFVTDQKWILHLDIKPENIMVSRYGKELVLIDFGRSKQVTKANRFIESNMPSVNYNGDETIESMYQYGTLGYAAPECYAEAEEDSKFPFTAKFPHGKMSEESDIFSMGATFWECLNIYELVTKSKEFLKDPHDFYRDHFLNDETYCNRDLSCTSLYYHEKLDRVIKKCTQKRTEKYLDPKSETYHKYYHSYKELRKDLEEVRNSAPTIVKEENANVKNAFLTSGILLSLFTIFLGIFIIYYTMAFDIAEDRWNTLVSNYNSTKFSQLYTIANDLMTTAPVGRRDAFYDEIAAFTYKDGDILTNEANMLVELLLQNENNNLLPSRIDEIMEKANAKEFRDISTEIMRLDETDNSVGYQLAKAIYNVEVGKTEITSAYETLLEYQYQDELRNAVVKLKNVLNNDENIQIIAVDLGLSRPEVKSSLQRITAE
jgi:serine/threonine protein kinase